MIAKLYIVSLRWRSPKLHISDKDLLVSSVSSFIPKSLAESRIEEIETRIMKQCPSHHIDFYIFLLAVICIVCSAIFTFIARSLNISMWCPLILLLVPTALSFWTSRRRSTFIIKIKEFECSIKKTLYEFNAKDNINHILWTVERVPMDQSPYRSARFCFMISVSELDPEIGLYGEELPSYQQSNMTTISLPPSYHESVIIRPPPAAVVI